ncbi:uncharacterized protein FPRO_12982 [Fusarium proliferatum ET1]|uniref:F-box domain-containing protein n=1 Tax=Fusarium proliferatum (strain ET1) TaxID=1227346 RepID=A0A1L7W748_FUSPR|nr:uncharacterized protein FPRO_12982 [Fusarium proliferatum ET1]CZR48372.1 uncharacterized protein FPRO_12982 [Fusarium proliferatum ET1]
MDEYSHLTYPSLRLNDHTLDQNVPTLQSEYSRRSFPLPISSLSALDCLPPELLEQILLYLDIRALINFQYVNRRSADLVNHLPTYKVIVTHARNALRGILCIQTGKWITCSLLLEKLHTSSCEKCGDFGGYLYLLTCKRVCFLCLSQEKEYLPLGLSHACRKFGLERAEVQKLPCLRVIPGTYSPNEKKANETFLVDYEAALNWAVAHHGSLDAMHTYVTNQNAKRQEDYERRLMQAQQGEGPRHIRKPPTGDPYDGRSGNPFRFVAIVSAPWLDRSSDTIEWGFHCLGCARSSRLPLHKRRKFIRSSFHDHIRECGNIEHGMHSKP